MLKLSLLCLRVSRQKIIFLSYMIFQMNTHDEYQKFHLFIFEVWRWRWRKERSRKLQQKLPELLQFLTSHVAEFVTQWDELNDRAESTTTTSNRKTTKKNGMNERLTTDKSLQKVTAKKKGSNSQRRENFWTIFHDCSSELALKWLATVREKDINDLRESQRNSKVKRARKKLSFILNRWQAKSEKRVSAWISRERLFTVESNQRECKHIAHAPNTRPTECSTKWVRMR